MHHRELVKATETLQRAFWCFEDGNTIKASGMIRQEGVRDGSSSFTSPYLPLPVHVGLEREVKFWCHLYTPT